MESVRMNARTGIGQAGQNVPYWRMDLASKSLKLKKFLRSNAPMLVAYSGGVDSTYLLVAAHQVLGAKRMQGIIADSPSLPREALKSALDLAESMGIPVKTVQTMEMENDDYSENPPNRCYFCKAELFRRMDRLAESGDYKSLAYGENLDDSSQIRPGSKAAREFRVVAPLRDAELTKRDIRELSRELGLPTADAPAQPCLSSRIPWGTPVTRDALAMIELAESRLRDIGFREFRVRHIVNGNGAVTGAGKMANLTAKLQFIPEEMPAAKHQLGKLQKIILETGYEVMELDPAGYTTARNR